MENMRDHIDLTEGYNLINSGDYNKAVSFFEKLLESNKNDTDFLYKLSEAYYITNKHKKALKTLDDLLKISPRSSDAIYLKAKTIFTYTDDKNKALDIALQALKLNPEDSFCNSLTALIYHSLENFDRAMDLANKALSLDPENYEACYVLGFILYSRGNRKDALDMLNNALQYGSKSIEQSFNVLLIQLEFFKIKEGLNLLRQASLSNPDNQAYAFLYKRLYFRNHFLNRPFAFFENYTPSRNTLFALGIAFIILVWIASLSDSNSITIINIFKWFSSLVLIVFVPYQLLVWLILNVYFAVVASKGLKCAS